MVTGEISSGILLEKVDRLRLGNYI